MNMLSSFPNALHPLFVHFPIVLWLAALLVTALSLGPDKQARWRVGSWLLHAGSAAAVAAAASGWLASEQLGHDSPGHGLVHGHRNYMLAALALSLLGSAVALVKRKEPTKAVKTWVVSLLSVTALVMTIGADRGAELVYRYGVGVEREAPPEGAAHGHGEDGGGHGEDAAGHGEDGAGHGDGGDHHGETGEHPHEGATAESSPSSAASLETVPPPSAPPASASSTATASPPAPALPKTPPKAPPKAPPHPTQGHAHPAGHEH